MISVKMRASLYDEASGVNRHISGAERIVGVRDAKLVCGMLIERAMTHSKGSSDFINMKIEKVNPKDIIHLEALKVTTNHTNTPEEGRQFIIDTLKKQGIPNGRVIVDMIQEAHNMRGAILLDVDSLKRLEPDKLRGIRATYMDSGVESNEYSLLHKNHYKEAIVLATKVANAPNIVGEICISDDPNYTTGYFACKELGYVRITNIKEMYSSLGGRIFLYQGKPNDVEKTLDFLQKQYVIVDNIKDLSQIETASRKEACSDMYGEESEIQKNDKWTRYENELKALEDKHLYRSMKRIDSEQEAHVKCQGKDMLMLASNSYLDIIRNDEVKKYVRGILDDYGAGSGGSRLTTGNTDIHEMLERKLAKFKGTEKALVFNTGYVANLAVISALCRKEDVIFSDELNHASIVDGCRLSKAEIVIYKHNDMKDLEEKAKKYRKRTGLIVSDAVFSMDGDIVNLPELIRIADTYGFLSMIDEAHATGVIGESGRGTVEHYHLDHKPDILIGTLSKAIGSEGGFVCGNKVLIEYLKNKARGFIFSTSLSPITMAAAYKAIDVIEHNIHMVKTLQENVLYFCKCLQKNGINADSNTPIFAIIIGNEERALRISLRLFELGYYILAIRYPTVAKGSARLRVALMSTHTKEELARTADVIGMLLREIR